jgi:competence protein ComEC
MHNTLLPDTEYNNPNNRSLVLRLDTAVFSYLFPGDINHHMEKKLISEAHWLKADVLLSPHHGSSSSNSPEFLSHVDPSYLVISAGRHNRFQFPYYSLLASREATGIQVYTTAKDGTVTFSGNGRDVSVSRYQVN